jgi:ubiquinone/menaquinone biosynthesis C-methylase UbiE
MVIHVDLYDSHYAHTEADTYRQIRLETYGEDLGQTSWITAKEARMFLSWLDLQPGSEILEVACGSGGVSLLAAREFGVTVAGIDINEQAVQRARGKAERDNIATSVSFQAQDASTPLPFPDGSFDVVLCIDSINHLPDRAAVLQDWFRLLKSSGKILYTDPIVVTGPISNQEIAVRSSIGLFLFMPFNENERLIRESGFAVLRAEDLTRSTATISKRWLEARSTRERLLVQYEEKERYEGLQHFLEVVHKLSNERRLSRFAYLAEKCC